MTSRPSTTELAALLPGDEYRADENGVTLSPAGVERLALGLRWARTRNLDAQVSRARLTAISAPDLTSCTVRAEAEAKLADVERALSAQGLTLGPLSPRVNALTVAAWLEGPDAGLRTVVGGRLETAALALEAVLWTGDIYRSHLSPRAAAGPDLDFGFLGGGGALGLVTSAVLRAEPVPTTVDRVTVRTTPEQATALLRAGLRHEVHAARASWDAGVLTVELRGLASRAHRDARRLGEAARGLSIEVLDSKAIDDHAPVHDFDVAWDTLPRALAQTPRALLHRIAREGAVVSADAALSGDGIVPLVPGARPAWLSAWVQALKGTA